MGAPAAIGARGWRELALWAVIIVSPSAPSRLPRSQRGFRNYLDTCGVPACDEPVHGSWQDA